MNDEVITITGGLITSQERSLWQAALKCCHQFRRARHAWLDAKIKLGIAEPLLARAREMRRWRRGDDPPSGIVKEYFNQPPLADIPDLTQVVLATCLEQDGVSCQCVELSALYDNSRRADELLSRAACVFLSSTYLHDLSELEAVVRRVKRPRQRLVVGGALMGALPDGWQGLPEIDVVAIGYGEYLIPALATWIRSGYERLPTPVNGRSERREHSTFLFSGAPPTRNLDDLPRPDWRLAASRRQGLLPMIYYESVRGCPYRCNFCNYPYLFADRVFRYKSAEKMADDWQHYFETLGVRYITCLDSLFTMPPERLARFCQLLIDRKLPIQWICYARADDLAREDVVAMMKAAGAHQVQIGIESGDAALLANMNKNCTVEANRLALENCRRHDLTSIISLIVGFPGETAQTLETTYRFLEQTPPDFYFLAAFSTRVAGIPLLIPETSAPFGLAVVPNLYSMAPYWRHRTMSCAEVGNHIRRLDQRLMRQRVALNATLFYAGTLGYRSEQREALLDFQQRVATRHPWIERVFDAANRWVDRRLRRDVARCFADRGEPAVTTPASSAAGASPRTVNV
jgi:tRNA A37 methylthiotransferase MiaB